MKLGKPTTGYSTPFASTTCAAAMLEHDLAKHYRNSAYSHMWLNQTFRARASPSDGEPRFKTLCFSSL